VGCGQLSVCVRSKRVGPGCAAGARVTIRELGIDRGEAEETNGMYVLSSLLSITVHSSAC
jgi:hypothetical protein